MDGELDAPQPVEAATQAKLTTAQMLEFGRKLAASAVPAIDGRYWLDSITGKPIMHCLDQAMVPVDLSLPAASVTLRIPFLLSSTAIRR